MSLQQRDRRKLIVAEEVRRPRQNGSRGTSGTFPGSCSFAWLAFIMEQQVAALIQQVMEMSERLRQSEEVAGQARQLLETHRSAGQILEERMNRAEAAATAVTLSAGGVDPTGPRCKKHQELMTGDSDLERLRRDINQRASAARTLRGDTGPGCFVPELDGSNEDEYKKSSEQRKPYPERKPL